MKTWCSQGEVGAAPSMWLLACQAVPSRITWRCLGLASSASAVVSSAPSAEGGGALAQALSSRASREAQRRGERGERAEDMKDA